MILLQIRWWWACERCRGMTGSPSCSCCSMQACALTRPQSRCVFCPDTELDAPFVRLYLYNRSWQGYSSNILTGPCIPRSGCSMVKSSSTQIRLGAGWIALTCAVEPHMQVARKANRPSGACLLTRGCCCRTAGGAGGQHLHRRFRAPGGAGDPPRRQRQHAARHARPGVGPCTGGGTAGQRRAEPAVFACRV